MSDLPPNRVGVAVVADTLDGSPLRVIVVAEGIEACRELQATVSAMINDSEILEHEQ